MLRNAFNHLTGRVDAARDLRRQLRRDARHRRREPVRGLATNRARPSGSAAKCCWPTRLQTRGDVWTSLTVIAALAGARLGLPILDPLAALVVAGFIGYAGYQIATATTRILSDRMVIAEPDISSSVVLSVPGRARLPPDPHARIADHVFLDLHVWLPPTCSSTDAHALSHVVKDRLMARYPQIADAIIHIEPPPPAATKARRAGESADAS